MSNDEQHCILTNGLIIDVASLVNKDLHVLRAAGNLFPSAIAAQEELGRRIAVWNEKYNTPTKQVSVAFEVKPLDEPRDYEWLEAMEAFDNNPDSQWRLPTRTELALLFKHRKDLGEFGSDFYWSSTAANEGLSAWYLDFNHGTQSTSYTFAQKALRLLRKEQQQ